MNSTTERHYYISLPCNVCVPCETNIMHVLKQCKNIIKYENGVLINSVYISDIIVSNVNELGSPSSKYVGIKNLLLDRDCCFIARNVSYSISTCRIEDICRNSCFLMNKTIIYPSHITNRHAQITLETLANKKSN